ncbi:MAG TPA: hypothetical protein VF543_17920 [Pyrinomonadaceae bacterium]|jgi:methionine-rich copper-binding protein CopC
MTEERIIAYLLKELPEEELEQFEDECLSQDDWPAEISVVEEELIDAYLRKELTQEQRARFERNYLTTEARRERVVMSAALIRHLDERCAAAKSEPVAPSSEPTLMERLRAFWSAQSWALPAVAACLIVAIVAGALWLTLFRTRQPGTFAALTLPISQSNRADAAQASRVRLPLNADALKISLTLPERVPAGTGYRAELEHEAGETKALEITVQDARSVAAVIPGSELRRGQYAVKLFVKRQDGTEERVAGSYFFTVE